MTLATLPLIEPQWPAPANVIAFTTMRSGGVSAAPYDSFNLGHHVGDAESAVLANRRALRGALPVGSEINWLNQVHGTQVLEAKPREDLPDADALWSRTPGMGCAILSADCLPVLMCTTGGDVVAAAHAGWRGLASGVLEATLMALGSEPDGVLAWLGPAIGPSAFEVGEDVLRAFHGASGEADGELSACFRPVASKPGHWHADLYALARLRLHRAGVTQVFGGDRCTFSDPQRFYSYRRNGVTGRMASVILLR